MNMPSATNAGGSNLRRRQAVTRLFRIVCAAATWTAVGVLVVLLIYVGWQGIRWLRPELILNFPSRFPAKAGLKSAIFGSLWIVSLTALFSIPVGVGAADRKSVV